MIKIKTPLGYECFSRNGFSDQKVFNEIFVEKIYEKPCVGFQVEAGETWLDLGANCGYFTQFALEKGAKVFAVDADYENQDIILALNSYENFLGLELAAVVPDSFKSKFVEFYKRTDKMTWKSSLFKVANSRKVSVPTLKFTELLERFGENVCVKMDIEGAEIPILIEKKEFKGIKKMAFEWSFDKEPRMKVLREVIQKLQGEFSKVYCPQKIDGIHQNWRGAANQFALVYCIR